MLYACTYMCGFHTDTGKISGPFWFCSFADENLQACQNQCELSEFWKRYIFVWIKNIKQQLLGGSTRSWGSRLTSSSLTLCMLHELAYRDNGVPFLVTKALYGASFAYPDYAVRIVCQNKLERHYLPAKTRVDNCSSYLFCLWERRWQDDFKAKFDSS